MNSELVLQELVEIMRCDTCKTHLRPPIYYCEDNTNLCESCTSNKEVEIIGENKKLESIGHLLKFPCCYATFGCKSRILWSEAKMHESECPFRQFECPVCSESWIGTTQNLKTHIQDYHKNKILGSIYNNLSLMQNENIRFIMGVGEPYMLRYNCDTDSGLLWFILKYIGPLEHANRRHYKLTLTRDDSSYYERKQVEPAVDWEINEDVAIKIDLCVLRMKLQLRNENVIKFRVDTYCRTPLYNGSVDEDLLRDVECTVCLDYMYAPIKQCISGHSVCNYCRPKLNSCPVCKQEMSEVRNFALESICSKMYYKCMYADDGCTFACLPKDISQHESTCNYGLFDCPFKTFIANCTWRGKLSQISSHTLEEHGLKF